LYFLFFCLNHNLSASCRLQARGGWLSSQDGTAAHRQDAGTRHAHAQCC
jgi:hypothetical protein